MVNLEQTSLCKQKVHGVAAVQFGTYCTEASIMNVMEFHSEQDYQNRDLVRLMQGLLYQKSQKMEENGKVRITDLHCQNHGLQNF